MRAPSMALRFSITRVRMKFWRSKHVMSTQPSRSLSISCRGEPISREDLFRYTKGRFLAREKELCDIRYLKFDVDQLCTIASSVGSKSPVRAIEKMEGGFSKALLMSKEDGSELVAKLPFPIAGPPKYLTASEAAILQFLHDHTKVPVPKLLAWNADASNPVGAEYVIMEKAAGCELYDKWAEMEDVAPLEFIKNLCMVEGELAAIDFPAYGSLYFQESMDNGEKYEPLAPEMDPSGRFCIGPSCERAWFHKDDTESIQARFDRGPWPTLSAFGIALAEREFARIELNPKPTDPDGPPRDSIEEQLATLEMAKAVFSKMDSNAHLAQLASPTLWHTDLHMGNIYVSHEDPTQITSLIDWQCTVVAPLFCQVRFPAFMKVEEDYEYGQEMPKLPENFDQMDEDMQAIADQDHKDALMAKTYEYGCGLRDWNIHVAIGLPNPYRNLFRRCATVWEDGAVPLRSCLVPYAEAWNEMGFSSDCPLKFSEDDIKKYEEDFDEYRHYYKTHEVARKLLCTDIEGWVHPSLNFEEVQERNRELLDMFIASCAEDGKSAEWARKNWPY